MILLTPELNQIRLRYTQAELIRLGLSVADGSMQYDDILAFIHSHR